MTPCPCAAPDTESELITKGRAVGRVLSSSVLQMRKLNLLEPNSDAKEVQVSLSMPFVQRKPFSLP